MPISNEKLNKFKVQILDLVAELNGTKTISNPILTENVSKRLKISPDATEEKKKLEISSENGISNYLEQFFNTASTRGPSIEDLPKAEISLLKDLIYPLQAIDGRYIKFDATKQKLSFLPDANNNDLCELPSCKIKAALMCCEVGISFGRVKAFLKDKKRDVNNFGLVEQRFCAEIENDVEEYYQFISKIESFAFGKDQGELFKGVEPPLTILKTLCIVEQHKEKFGFLSKLCDSVKNLSGTSLLGELSRVIAPYCREQPFYNRALTLFRCSAEPLTTMFYHWLSVGQVEDRFNEYFIKEKSEPFNGSSLSIDEKFVLREEMAPCFFPEKTLRKALRIGKTVNYVLQFSPETTELLDLSGLKKKIRWEDSQTVESTVDEVEKRLGLHFTTTLFEKFHFKSHLENIEGFVLLCQGDFVNSLLNDSLQLMLKNERECNNNNVDPLIQKALFQHQTRHIKDSASTKNSEFTLQLSKVDDNNSIYVLDLFGIQYVVKKTNPLRIILQEKHQSHYKIIFNYIWKLKFATKILSLVWKSNRETFLKFPFDRETPNTITKMTWKKFRKRCYRLRFGICCIIQRMQMHLFYNAIKPFFNDFMAKCQTSATISDLKENHALFLDNLLQELFLNKTQVYHSIICLIKTTIDIGRKWISLNNDVYFLKETDEEKLKSVINEYGDLLKKSEEEFEKYSKPLNEYLQ